MTNPVPPSSSEPKPASRPDDSRVISAILAQIPALLRVKQVRNRDGELEPFAPEKIGASFATALAAAGISDEVLLARCTHQALALIDRQCDGRLVPTTDDVARAVAQVLIDNGLADEAQQQFDGLGLGVGGAAALSAIRVTGKGVRFRRRLTSADERLVEDGSAAAVTAAGVASTGREYGYFASDDDATIFAAELGRLLAAEKISFAGEESVILSVRDDRRKHTALAATEKYAGSGARFAADLSALSSPLVFLQTLEALPRRGAGMVTLAADHPEAAAFAAQPAGESAADRSLRASDEFMRRTSEGGDAGALLRKIATAAAEGGAFGLQFESAANRGNPVANSGRVTAARPDGSFLFLDDTAAAPVTVDVSRCRRDDGSFDTAGFMQAVEYAVAASDIMLQRRKYASAAVERNCIALRPLAIGMRGISALFAALGIAPESDAGVNVAAALAALCTGHAYFQSGRLADGVGAFADYPINETPFLKVIGMHRDRAYALAASGVPTDLFAEARRAWDNALEFGMAYGFRNSQVTALAADAFDASAPIAVRLRLLAAMQPLISGGAAFAVSFDAGASREEVEKIFVDAWKAGLKGVLVTAREKSSVRTEVAAPAAAQQPAAPPSSRAPDERLSITHRFVINGHAGHLIVSLDEAGMPCEIFIRMTKGGATAALVDAFAVSTSLALRHGTPLSLLVAEFPDVAFEPYGATEHPVITRAASIVDYVFRWLAWKFLS